MTDLRTDALAGANGVPVLAAVALALGLGANRPDDGPEIRLRWPLSSSIASALEIMDDPALDAAMIVGLTRSRAEREGLILTDDLPR